MLFSLTGIPSPTVYLAKSFKIAQISSPGKAGPDFSRPSQLLRPGYPDSIMHHAWPLSHMRCLFIDCACVRHKCLSDMQQSASPAVSLPHSPSAGREGGGENTKIRGPEKLDDPKTSVSSGVATPAQTRQAVKCTVRAGREQLYKNSIEMTEASKVGSFQELYTTKHSKPAIEVRPRRQSPTMEKLSSSFAGQSLQEKGCTPPQGWQVGNKGGCGKLSLTQC